MQKNQALAETKIQLEQMKANLDMQKMQQEAELKKQLMQLEFEMNMQLKQVETEALTSRESQKEDRKDQRTKIQATQQSEMIEQRQTGRPPKNFEQPTQDNLGGFNLGA